MCNIWAHICTSQSRSVEPKQLAINSTIVRAQTQALTIKNKIQLSWLYIIMVNVQSHSMLNLTNLHSMYTPFNFFFFFFCFVLCGMVAGIDEMWRSWKFQLFVLFCFVFSCFVGYSDLNFRCFSTKNAKYIATWKTTLRGAKFCDKPPCNV